MELSLLLQNLLYGVTIGSALILIASGLSLTFGVMGVLNFAHGGLCMLGAYFGYTIVQVTGNFWLAMILAPLIVAGISILLEIFKIRPLYGLNPLLQLLLTVGLSMVIANAVLLSWGGIRCRSSSPPISKVPFHFSGWTIPVSGSSCCSSARRWPSFSGSSSNEQNGEFSSGPGCTIWRR
jgi:branched-chain amino acid transport system permease protein